jgi:hypothetical protein
MFSTGHTEGGKVNRVYLPCWPFRPSPARVLVKAQAEFEAAYHARCEAEDRGDCREMRPTRERLFRARNTLMAAQKAVNPLPPMPRRGAPA